MSERTAAAALDRVRAAGEETRAAHDVYSTCLARLKRELEKARDEGVPSAEIATAAGVTAARVRQLAPVTKRVRPRNHAQEQAPAVSCVTDQARVPTVADHVTAGEPLVSGMVSSRKRRPYGRVTVFYRDGMGVEAATLRKLWLGWPDHTNALDNVLRLVEEQMPDAGTVRVFLTGARPFEPNGVATMAEQVREWATAPPREGWVVTSTYLRDADLPVIRFRHEATSRDVVVMRAAAWWGESEADQETCAMAWRGLERAINQVQPFKGVGMADTPSTMGLALWQRTIPEDKAYPVLSDELRALLAATAGQGRVELRPAASKHVDSFTVLDGRFMYSSLTHNMPVGEPTLWTGAQVDAWTAREWQQLIRGRGRWRVRVTVPEGWGHVGLLMAPGSDGTWRYPCEPGETFETWADGAELWAAMEAKASGAGWQPEVLEGFTWSEGKPLERWTKELLGLWRQVVVHDKPAAKLAAKALRQIVVATIGAFSTKAHPITHTAPLDADPDVPAGTEVRRVGDQLVWEERRPLSGWSGEVNHPEWSATIWARARTRLLTGRGVNGATVGALHLPAENVIGFATDAMYLTSDPGWADDGGAGRFRVKGQLDKRAAWPTTYSELHKLRDRAEGA